MGQVGPNGQQQGEYTRRMRITEIVLAWTLAPGPNAHIEPAEPETDGAFTPFPSEPATNEAAEAPKAAPPPKACKREDFENFDAFVECRIAEQGEPVPPAPPVETAAERNRRAIDEAMGRTEEDLAANAAAAAYNRRVSIILLATGLALDVIGVSLLAAGYAQGTKVEAPSDDGPICMVGQRCGDACIAVTDTCHVGANSGPTTVPKAALAWPGAAAIVIGSGLLVAALVVHVRTQAAPSRVIVNARGIGIRF